MLSRATLSPPPLTCAESHPRSRATGSTPSLRDTVIHSTVRVNAHAREYNVLRPFQQSAIHTGVGSGVIIDPARLGAHARSGAVYVLTCEHVVSQAHEVFLVFPSFSREEHAARILAVCEDTDLAILECVLRDMPPGLQPLPLGDSDKLQEEARVRAYGFPLGQTALKVTDGVYSGYQDSKLQHSSPISKGNSGGPLLNEQGEVVGINSAVMGGAANMGYAVPSFMVEVLLRDVAPLPPQQAPHIVRRHTLGIHVHATTPATLRYLGASGCGHAGVQVRFMYRHSPLQGRISEGDLIVGVDGLGIDHQGDVCVPWNQQKVALVDYLHRKCNHDDVELQVWRPGSQTCELLTTKQADVHVEGFHLVAQPHEMLDFVLFAGIVFQPLRANHEPPFQRTVAELGYEKQQRPQLIVTDLIPGTHAYKADNIRPGKLVHRVNGRRTRSLEDLLVALSQPLFNAQGEPFMVVQTTRGRQLTLSLVDVLQEQKEKCGKLWPDNIDVPNLRIAALVDKACSRRGSNP